MHEHEILRIQRNSYETVSLHRFYYFRLSLSLSVNCWQSELCIARTWSKPVVIVTSQVTALTLRIFVRVEAWQIAYWTNCCHAQIWKWRNGLLFWFWLLSYMWKVWEQRRTLHHEIWVKTSNTVIRHITQTTAIMLCRCGSYGDWVGCKNNIKITVAKCVKKNSKM